MMLQIAFRNLLRNKARTILGVLMVAGAVTVVILFRGFSHYVLDITRTNLIKNQLGHIQVATKEFWEPGTTPKKQQLMAGAPELIQKVSGIPEVEFVSGRLDFNGLISTGESTLSAWATCYDPRREPGMRDSIGIVEGRSFDDDSKREVIVGSGLQKYLNLKVGQNLSVLTYTLDGVVNAADFEIIGFFTSGVVEIDNHVFFLTLEDGQMLLDTPLVGNVMVWLKDRQDLSRITDQVREFASSESERNTTKTWYELSKFFRQLESFQRGQDALLEGILVVLILLGIMNAIGMAIYERTGEIGTIRALGETEGSVIKLFILESALLGIFGVLAGMAAGTFLSYAISLFQFTIDIPMSSRPILVKIDRPLGAYVEAAIICFTTTVIAATIPALRASKISIVEALKKNI